MTMENIPWALLGGITSASLGRMLAYQATQGEEGVAGIGDFRVRQTSVASANIRMDAGGAILLNRYPGVKNESYMCRAGDETQISVPANSSGVTRYDLVVARIDDWNAPGGQAVPGTLPTNTVAAAKFQVITNVASSTKAAWQLGLNYPAIALARLAVPAGTSAITQAMITDLRQKAMPRRKRDIRAIAQLAGRDNDLTVIGTGGERFPNDALWDVEVPIWATQVTLRADLSGILAPAGSSYGSIWIRWADQTANAYNTQATLIDFTSPTADPSRVSAMVAQAVPVISGIRGTTQKVAIVGRKLGGTVNLKADGATGMVMDMEFLEAPTEDI